MVQMHQCATLEGEFLGGGFSETEDYMTWTVQVCDNCGDFYVELYRTFRVPDKIISIDELKAYIISEKKGGIK
jgi:hypothetical protein